jgi:hypothetical protein
MQNVSADRTTDLAMFTSGYIETKAAAPLQRHFQCVWLYRAPDGCVDLRWADGKLMVVGPDRIAKTETVVPGSTVVGLRFQPAAAAHWLGLPMSELVNCRVDLEDIWGGAARQLIDTIGEKRDPAIVAELLQKVLTQKSAMVEPASKDMAAFFAMLNRVSESQPASLANAVEQLGTSERTLRRRCHEAFGYGPKTLQRILRMPAAAVLPMAQPLQAMRIRPISAAKSASSPAYRRPGSST